MKSILKKTCLGCARERHEATQDVHDVRVYVHMYSCLLCGVNVSESSVSRMLKHVSDLVDQPNPSLLLRCRSCNECPSVEKLNNVTAQCRIVEQLVYT